MSQQQHITVDQVKPLLAQWLADKHNNNAVDKITLPNLVAQAMNIIEQLRHNDSGAAKQAALLETVHVVIDALQSLGRLSPERAQQFRDMASGENAQLVMEMVETLVWISKTPEFIQMRSWLREKLASISCRCCNKSEPGPKMPPPPPQSS